MRMIVIPIVIGALGTILKGIVKELEELEIRGRTETIRTTALFSSTRILRRVLETSHSDSNTKPSVNASVKYSQWVIS